MSFITYLCIVLSTNTIRWYFYFFPHWTPVYLYPYVLESCARGGCIICALEDAMLLYLHTTRWMIDLLEPVSYGRRILFSMVVLSSDPWLAGLTKTLPPPTGCGSGDVFFEAWNWSSFPLIHTWDDTLIRTIIGCFSGIFWSAMILVYNVAMYIADQDFKMDRLWLWGSMKGLLTGQT